VLAPARGLAGAEHFISLLLSCLDLIPQYPKHKPTVHYLLSYDDPMTPVRSLSRSALAEVRDRGARER
jgi:hypothetical protein